MSSNNGAQKLVRFVVREFKQIPSVAYSFHLFLEDFTSLRHESAKTMLKTCARVLEGGTRVLVKVRPPTHRTEQNECSCAQRSAL